MNRPGLVEVDRGIALLAVVDGLIQAGWPVEVGESWVSTEAAVFMRGEGGRWYASADEMYRCYGVAELGRPCASLGQMLRYAQLAALAKERWRQG